MQRVRRNRQGGYTIIELMIVVAVVGILAVLTLPNLSGWIGTMRLNQASQHVKQTVENTRKLALSSGVRHCLRATTDSNYADGKDNNYLITFEVLAEDSRNIGTWTAITAPPELSGWTNSPTSDQHKGVSLEGGTNTTNFGSVQGCQGLLFTTFGYSQNPNSDFTNPCGGQNCAILTLRNKSRIGPIEQRTLWIDRGGNVRVTQNPDVIPGNGAS